MNEVVEEFPVWGLLPKRETGVTQLLNKYPQYDGRGVVIAIFDSGVDPGAPGLQTTTEGKLKVIERYDCSGAGDVDTSTVVTPNDGIITGLTGRKLKIPDGWDQNCEYHIGVKNSFELYPCKVKERMKKTRKEKLWDEKHKKAVAEAYRKAEVVSTGGGESPPGVEKLNKEERDTEIELLNSYEKKYNDVGPTYDCVVFHDGKSWRLCIDTSECGDLSSGVSLGEYNITHEYAPITDEDQLNVTINVYDAGNLVEIVSMCSPHGTHVASIASAHFPDEPEKNGVAPGAQIISLSIGDIRLTSMETGTALVRAMINVMKRTADNPIHVINMSYGEHVHWSSAGHFSMPASLSFNIVPYPFPFDKQQDFCRRVGELVRDVVDKHRVTWVVSAGNHGPALSTVSTPPDINYDCLIGVGAYVSPDMMSAEYSMLEKLPGMPYTWSSRGPTPDGGWAISVCAPGGAITSVPTFTLRSAQLMNGTSMAAPHVTGAVAVLMSGMMQRGLKFSPHSIRRALENSAVSVPDLDVFAQGYGLLQIEKAFEHLCTNHDSLERDIRFAVQCTSQNSKGIYIRSGLLNERAKEYAVTVTPVFQEEADKREMIDFNMRLILVTSCPWVQAPTFLDLTNLSRTFTVRVEPAGLPVGVHTASIGAYDSKNPDKGPVFRIPVTLVQPELVTSQGSFDFAQLGVPFKAGQIKRHFLLVPETATWAVLTMRAREKDKCGKFMVHCTQLLPKQSVKTIEFQKLFVLASHSDVINSFAVRGGLILEVAVAQFWSSLQKMDVDYEVVFRGTKPDQPSITMHGADGVHMVELATGSRTEEIVPSVALKSSVLVLRPSENKISACCGERDVIPPGRQIYELVLTYNLHLSKSFEVSPSCPLLCEFLYESEYESQMWMLYDTNKQLLAVGDAYPSKYTAKLDKGEYTIKMGIRHEKRSLLENLTDLVMLVSQKLCQPLPLDLYISQSQAMIQGKKIASAVMPPSNAILPIFIGPLPSEKTSKNFPFGHYLQGTISYAKDELGKKVDIYRVKYVMPDPPIKKKPENNNKEKENKSKSEEFDEAMRDYAISLLAKLEPGERATELFEKLKEEHPDHWQVHSAMLSCIDPLDYKKTGVLPLLSQSDPAINIRDHITNEDDFRKRNENVISICNEIIAGIDQSQILAQLALKNDVRPDAAKQKMLSEKQKQILVDAYVRKGCALARLQLLDPEHRVEPLQSIWCDIVALVCPNDLKVGYFMLWHAVVSGHYSRALRILGRMSEDKSAPEIDEKMVEMARKLGWTHISDMLTSALPYKFPTTYRKF